MKKKSLRVLLIVRIMLNIFKTTVHGIITKILNIFSLHEFVYIIKLLNYRLVTTLTGLIILGDRMKSFFPIFLYNSIKITRRWNIWIIQQSAKSTFQSALKNNLIILSTIRRGEKLPTEETFPCGLLRLYFGPHLYSFSATGVNY